MGVGWLLSLENLSQLMTKRLVLVILSVRDSLLPTFGLNMPAHTFDWSCRGGTFPKFVGMAMKRIGMGLYMYS